MANPNALFLLADHVKLSLLERQRTKALDLLQDNGSNDGSGDDAQDGHIARSLDQFREGLELLAREQTRLEEEGATGKALAIADALPTLTKQLQSLTAQFQGEQPVSSAAPAPAAAAKKPKSVRFRQAQNVNKPLPRPPAEAGREADLDRDIEAQRAGLFNRPYRDDDEDRSLRDSPAFADDQDNGQLLQTHARILADQDAQLDALGASISRQRELSMQIGDELDTHVAMLEESERLTDQHQSRLDRARRQVGRISRSSGGDCRQMGIIIALIVILVLLIAILK